jgi:hypothetical protein
VIPLAAVDAIWSAVADRPTVDIDQRQLGDLAAVHRRWIIMALHLGGSSREQSTQS